MWYLHFMSRQMENVLTSLPWFQIRFNLIRFQIFAFFLSFLLVPQTIWKSLLPSPLSKSTFISILSPVQPATFSDFFALTSFPHSSTSVPLKFCVSRLSLCHRAMINVSWAHPRQRMLTECSADSLVPSTCSAKLSTQHRSSPSISWGRAIRSVTVPEKDVQHPMTSAISLCPWSRIILLFLACFFHQSLSYDVFSVSLWLLLFLDTEKSGLCFPGLSKGCQFWQGK